MSARLGLRRAALAFAAGGLVLVGALGVVWQRNRNASWEQPHWDSGRFEQLIGEPIAGRALHVVAVHPQCSHCLVSLEREVAHRRRMGAAHRLAALIVDTPSRPDLGRLPLRGEDEVWWDRAGLWRHRWGHRIYGEVLMFDAAGKYLRTKPARVVNSTEINPDAEPSSTNIRERPTSAEKGDFE